MRAGRVKDTTAWGTSFLGMLIAFKEKKQEWYLHTLIGTNLLIINKMIMIITIDSLNNIILYRCIVNSNFDCKFCGNRLYFIENDNQRLIAEE